MHPVTVRYDVQRARASGLSPAWVLTTYGVPTFSYNNFIDTSALPVTVPIGLTWGGNSHLPTSSSIQYTLNIQRTLAKSTVLELL